MTERYKLLFRGEVLDGQHPAVVRKRLAALASYSGEHLDLLFSGQPVVVKRAADPATAERLQALFRQAGARLRVAPAAAAGAPAAAGADNQVSGGAGLQLLPSGSPVLRDDERRAWQAREVDTSRLSVAETGARLSTAVEQQAPVIDAAALAFDVAPAGAPLSEPKPMEMTPVPDTSHLRIA